MFTSLCLINQVLWSAELPVGVLLATKPRTHEPARGKNCEARIYINYTRYTGGSAGWLVFAGTLVFFFRIERCGYRHFNLQRRWYCFECFFFTCSFCKFGLRAFSHTKWRTTSMKLLQYRETDMLQMQQIHICHLKLTFLILFLETVQNLLVHGYRGLKLHLMSQLYLWIRPNFSLWSLLVQHLHISSLYHLKWKLTMS